MRHAESATASAALDSLANPNAFLVNGAFEQDVAAQPWRKSLQRGVALGLTLAVHLGLLAIVTLPPAAMRVWRMRAAQRDDALQVRLIAADPAPAVRAATRRPSALPVMSSPHGMPKRPSPQAPPGAAPATSVPRLAASPASPGHDAAFTSGDGGFAARLHRAQERHRPAGLPGSSHPIVAGLDMVDPRSQGLAGAIRAVAGIFGAEDPHCVEVDAWRGMTRRELAEHDKTTSDVEQTAKSWHCGPTALPMAARY